ncbi:YraN family protein [Corynebacterium sp.]|uniref:YraN family protein n=1 Tax=Corynebacterium sp. TaxID=1720 RepID=UPI0025BEF24C|nr:YraN family protein [Corynebacterium sp.]
MSAATNTPGHGRRSSSSQQRRPQAPRNLRDVGAAGEDTAAGYFLERGYRLLDRNFYTARGEVDIVLSGDGVIVFVEVKWRTDGRFGSGAEAVTPAKLAAMRHAGAEWLRRNPRHRAPTVRFDVLDITAGELTHYEGVGW